LCLKSSEYGGFRAAGGFPGFLSSRQFGIPNGIPGYPKLIFGIPKSVMEYISCALKPPASPTASSRRSNRKTRTTSSPMATAPAASQGQSLDAVEFQLPASRHQESNQHGTRHPRE
jgi:hypothetical protein